MVLGGLQKITLIDFPGKIAAIVFTSGCSFRCGFCYNSSLVLPEKIKNHQKITEKDFSNLAFSRGVDSPGIARVRSAGDKALFGGHTTEEMKARIGVPNKKPLADYLPDVTLKAKDLATAMTIENVRRENIQGETHIKHRHVASNHNVRGALINTGIIPESLPAGEDIKKIESRHRKELKALQDRHREELKHLTKN